MQLSTNSRYTDNITLTGGVEVSNLPSDRYTLETVQNMTAVVNDRTGASFFISCSNVDYILSHANIIDRRIDKKCIIVKDIQGFVLLPENSELYTLVLSRNSFSNQRLFPGRSYILEFSDNVKRGVVYLGSFVDVRIYISRFDRKNEDGFLVFKNHDISLYPENKYFYFMDIETGRVIAESKRESFTIVQELYGSESSFRQKAIRQQIVRDFCLEKHSTDTYIIVPSSRGILNDVSALCEENHIIFEDN